MPGLIYIRRYFTAICRHYFEVEFCQYIYYQLFCDSVFKKSVSDSKMKHTLKFSLISKGANFEAKNGMARYAMQSLR